MDVPQYPAEALAMRAEGHVEIQLTNGTEPKLVGTAAGPGLTILRAVALENVRTWRFEGYEKDENVIYLAKFDYVLPKECGLPWSVNIYGDGEVRIVGSLPCAGKPDLYRRIERYVMPGYPPIAKTARISGIVQSRITIAEDGTVVDAQALHGHPMLIRSTPESLKKLKFAAAAATGEISQLFYISYHTCDDYTVCQTGMIPAGCWGITIYPDGLEFQIPAPLVETSDSQR